MNSSRNAFGPRQQVIVIISPPGSVESAVKNVLHCYGKQLVDAYMSTAALRLGTGGGRGGLR